MDRMNRLRILTLVSTFVTVLTRFLDTKLRLCAACSIVLRVRVLAVNTFTKKLLVKSSPKIIS